MRENLTKCMERNQVVELVYLDSKGIISQRRVKILNIHGATFRGFCFRRNAKRTFSIENVLACVPVIYKEREVV